MRDIHTPSQEPLLTMTNSSFNDTPCIGDDKLLQGQNDLALVVICALGVLLNVYTLVVLTSARLARSRASATYTFLAWLAAADGITVAVYLVEAAMHFDNTDIYYRHFYEVHIYLPLGTISTTSSLLLTTTFTIHRFLYVRTLQSKEISKSRAHLISATVVGLAIMVNLPRMFIWTFDSNMTPVCKRHSAYTDNDWYEIYNWTRFFVVIVGSLTLMTVFNTLLVSYVRKTATRRKSLFSRDTDRTNKDNKLSVTIIVTVFICIAAELPSAIYSRMMMGIILGEDVKMDQQPHKAIIQIAFYLLIVNHSANFVVYFILNKAFRQGVYWTICVAKQEESSGPSNRPSLSLQRSPPKKSTSIISHFNNKFRGSLRRKSSAPGTLQELETGTMLTLVTEQRDGGDVNTHSDIHTITEDNSGADMEPTTSNENVDTVAHTS